VLGRPLTPVTTTAFLDHFDLASLDDLPRVEELAAAGLFDTPAEPSPQDEASDEAAAGGVGDPDAT
jgi:segregation and condensation protein B